MRADVTGAKRSARQHPACMAHVLDTLALACGDDVRRANDDLYALGVTDGLPVIVPTGQRVDAMLGSLDASATIATLAPMMEQATAYRIAVCAVMAGCLPEYMPVVLAAVKSVAREEFNLLGVQTTTGTAAPAIIVNGPIARQLKMNCSTNALGPGSRANATIGRALSLVLRNIGGALPGELDMATMGQPGKYTFCFAENEAANPWTPLHATRGFDARDSAVTVAAAAGTMEVRDECSKDAGGVLTTFAHSMIAAGSAGGRGLLSGGEPLVLIAPDHARIIGKEMGREAVQKFLFEKATLEVEALSDEMRVFLQRARGAENVHMAPLRVAPRPEDIMLVVVGGSGVKSSYIPTWGGDTRAVTTLIES